MKNWSRRDEKWARGNFWNRSDGLCGFWDGCQWQKVERAIVLNIQLLCLLPFSMEHKVAFSKNTHRLSVRNTFSSCRCPTRLPVECVFMCLSWLLGKKLCLCCFFNVENWRRPSMFVRIELCDYCMFFRAISWWHNKNIRERNLWCENYAMVIFIPFNRKRLKGK